MSFNDAVIYRTLAKYLTKCATRRKKQISREYLIWSLETSQYKVNIATPPLK